LEVPSRGWRGGNLHLRMLRAKCEQLRAMSCQWCCGFPSLVSSRAWVHHCLE
jgi:hypothetical protein